MYTFEAVEDSVESALSLYSRRSVSLYWLVIACLALVVCVIPFIEVDVSIGVAGVIRSAHDRIVVHATGDGYVREITASDNATVRSGQPIMSLESASLRERLKFNASRINELGTRRSDLDKLLDFVADLRYPKSGSLARTPVPPPPILAASTYTKQYDAFAAQLRTINLRAEEAGKELERGQALFKQGLITPQSLDQSKYAYDQVIADREQSIETTLSRWNLERRDCEETYLQLLTEARQLHDESDKRLIVAPIAGTLLGFTGFSPGSYIPAGTILGEISPDGAIAFEARVSPKDIGFVRRGQSAKLQVDAFHYTQWGTLDAIVDDISNDIILDRSGAAFKVILRVPNPKLISSTGLSVSITKGMSANARLMVTRRTLLQLLYQNMAEWIDPRGAKY